ncbi:unnamed protein product [Coregonus sp. 'balchen']|nr:unnamed protein product [Coregonus sp. 'balchen']
MAPTHNNKKGLSRDEDEYYGIKVDRKTRKPLVEKKRRARINESLQELRVLLADTDLQSKMENAEVLEMTVHTFVSNCPGIDATLAAELLNHLLECMPLNDEDRLQVMLQDIMTDCSTNSSSTWPSSEGIYAALVSAGGRSISSGSSSALSPAPSTSSSDDLCSDLDETDSEQSHISVDAENQDVLNMPTVAYSKSMWRPW